MDVLYESSKNLEGRELSLLLVVIPKELKGKAMMMVHADTNGEQSIKEMQNRVVNGQHTLQNV